MQATPQNAVNASAINTLELVDDATRLSDQIGNVLSLVEITSAHLLDVLDSRADDLVNGSIDADHKKNFFYITPECQRRLHFLAGELEERTTTLSATARSSADTLFHLHAARAAASVGGAA